jgi:hypothetical protein
MSHSKLQRMVGKSVLAPNLEDYVMRGENVVVTHEGSRRIARIEDIKHWSELTSSERPADANEEWSCDMFLQVRLYERRETHSFSRRKYPHLDRVVELELGASSSHVVWLPAMNVVGVAFVAHARDANAMTFGMPFDQPLENAFVVCRKTNGNLLNPDDVHFFPDDGPYKYSRYGRLTTHASRTKREWNMRCGIRSLVAKLMRRDIRVGNRDRAGTDTDKLVVDPACAAALFDQLSGTKWSS